MGTKRFLFVILLAAVALAAVAEVAAPLRRFAFVAGSNNGGDSLERLKYAETDARSFAAVMQDLGGLQPQDLVLVTSPDLQRFEDALVRVRQMVKSPRLLDERRELVFYYSGHSDDEGLILNGVHFAWQDLKKEIGDIPADFKIAILDSCSSGSLTRAKGGVARPAFLYDASSDMTGQAFLTSASAEEAAQESDKIGGSFFTHYLISALRGAADNVGDGLVTLDEAYEYAFRETLASTERTEYGPQHPAREFDMKGSGKIVLTDLRSSAAGVIVADDITGRLYFRDSQGDLAVELNKQYGQKVELGLEPGTYSVVLDNKGTRTAADIRVTTRQRATLTLAAMKPVPLDKATARGDESGAAPQAAGAADPGAAFGAAVGSIVGSAIGKAVGSVGAAIDAAAAAVQGSADAARTPPDAPADEPISAAPPRPQPFSFSLLPDVSRGVFSSLADHVVALNLFIGVSHSSYGFEVASLANFESGNVAGFQAAGLANVALGELSGFQAAGLVNAIAGPARFFQSAGLVNVSGGLAGGQAAGLANVSIGTTRGAQMAGIVNWSTEDARGAQLAGVFNWSGQEIRGAQIAGVANWAASIRGPQISVVNVAGDVSGAQIGLLNIARHVTGTQIGVLNISDKIDGIPIGLLSIEGQGRHGIDLWMDLDGNTNLAFSLGTRHLYTILSGAWSPGIDPSLWSIGLGVGGRSELGSTLFIDYDLSIVTVRHGLPDGSQVLNLLNFAGPDAIGASYPRLRAVIGLPLFGGISINAGAVVRILVPYLSTALPGADPVRTVFQPSFIVGVNL